jgi:hypothetical protein
MIPTPFVKTLVYSTCFYNANTQTVSLNFVHPKTDILDSIILEGISAEQYEQIRKNRTIRYKKRKGKNQIVSIGRWKPKK